MASTETPTSTTSPQKTLYKGSCHCGFVTYTVGLDFKTPTPAMQGAILSKCNCTICLKSGATLADPGDDPVFTLLTPAEGEAALRDYTFASCRIHWFGCPKCGIYCFVKATFEEGGREVKNMRVNVLTLDGKADGTPMENLRDLKMRYWDARDFSLGSSPSYPTMGDEPGPGGMW